MKYMLLVYGDEENSMTASERDQCYVDSARLCRELAVEKCDPFIKRLPAHQHILNQEADARADLPSRLLKKLGDPKSQFSPALRHNDAAFEQDSA